MSLSGRGLYSLLAPGNKVDPFNLLVALLGFCAVMSIANLVLAAFILGLARK